MIKVRIITIEELLMQLQKYNHRELHVHHTWRPEHSNFDGKNGIDLQQNMRNYHVNTNGWDDIAQHVTLLPDGKFVTGRAFSSQPASIKGYNGSNGSYPFMVEMLGNFDVGHDKLEGPQKESILRLAKYFDDRGKYIRFHRENAAKSCPGTGIDKAKFMAEVKAFLYPPVIPKEEPRVETSIVPQWKLDVVKQAEDLGIIEKGKHKPEETPDKAFVLAAILNALKGV